MSENLKRHYCVGPMGSKFWRIEVPPDAVPSLAEKFDWNRLGRRVMIDAVGGIISWMNPSGAHADFSDAVDKTVEWAARLLDAKAKSKRDTRWKRPEDPKNTGLEPDASFYVGASAESWYAELNEGDEAVEAFEAATPPDLVVEVEVAHFDGERSSRYAAVGIREMWRVSRKSRGSAVEVEILVLQAPDGPRSVGESLVLPGLAAQMLPEALVLARQGRFADLDRLLAAALAPGSARRAPE